MAYDEKIAYQVRELIFKRTDKVEERVMFGGLCFMVNDKICMAVKKDTMLLRLDPDVYAVEIEKDGRKPMIHSGKAIMSYLFLDLDMIHTHNDLVHYVNLALDYNPHAPLSKAKQKLKK